jgi:hypothetical protein
MIATWLAIDSSFDTICSTAAVAAVGQARRCLDCRGQQQQQQPANLVPVAIDVAVASVQRTGIYESIIGWHFRAAMVCTKKISILKTSAAPVFFDSRVYLVEILNFKCTFIPEYVYFIRWSIFRAILKSGTPAVVAQYLIF